VGFGERPTARDADRADAGGNDRTSSGTALAARPSDFTVQLMKNCTSPTLIAVIWPLSGCAMAPSVNVLGSFFPAWLICIVIGIAAAVLSRRLLVATGIAPHVGAPTLIYPCLGGLWIFATWLLLFGS
jgi:YtcA-like protein